MKTIEYKVSYEKMISRLPGLFAYLEADDYGVVNLHRATDSLDGCWGKIVENIKIPYDLIVRNTHVITEEDVNNGYKWNEQIDLVPMVDDRDNEKYLENLICEKLGCDRDNIMGHELYLYNQAYGTSLTAAQSFHTPEFLRYAAYIIDLYKTRLSKLSTLFNIEGIERFTPAERMKMVFLGEFVSASKSFLYSDTFHESFVRLPDGIETVPYWQGTGSTYATSYTSEIDLEFDDGNNGKNAVNIAGVIGIMFDEEAAGVSCLERNMTMHRNDRAQFQNVWEHMKAGYYNDFSENAVVFFVA